MNFRPTPEISRDSQMTDTITPLVSVLMTVFNREKYVATAIESVLAQTLTDFELIIVDDGSTDRSMEIARSYLHDPRVRISVNVKNLGDYPNRNHAARLSTGKYLKYVDSDDAILPHCLEIMTHMMESHPNAGVLLWSSEGEPWYPFELSPQDVYRRGFFSGRRFERAPLSLLLRKDTFDKVGGFDERWKLGADMEFCYRIARYYPVLYGPQGLVFYRVHEGQIVSTTEDSTFKHAAEATMILVGALRHPDCPLPPAERAWHLTRMLYGSYRNALTVAFKKGRIATAWTFIRSIGCYPREYLPLLAKRPLTPAPPMPGPPDWSDFPPPPSHHVPHGPTCLVSIILAPERLDTAFTVCLDSLLRQRHTALDIIVVLDERQSELAQYVDRLQDPRCKIIATHLDSGVWERFNQAADEAVGTYCKFIGPEMPLLYPYALEIEVSVLEKRSKRDFLSAGCAGFTLGGLDLDPEEALALDVGTDGHYVRSDPSCVLIRRKALGDNPFDQSLGQWALVDLLYRLAVRSGAVLGPYGLTTAWRRYEPWPTEDLPDILKERTLALYQETKNARAVPDWTALITKGRKLAAEMPARCQWHSGSWILPDTVASCHEERPCA